jgi:hypothetical protein
MIGWDNFNLFAIFTLICWVSAFGLLLFSKKTRLGLLLTGSGADFHCCLQGSDC